MHNVGISMTKELKLNYNGTFKKDIITFFFCCDIFKTLQKKWPSTNFSS